MALNTYISKELVPGTGRTDNNKNKIQSIAQELFQSEQATLYPLQEWAYKKGQQKKNMLIVAPTGSGKTEAATLAVRDWGRVAYALPMRTLANSLQKRLNEYEHNLTGETWSIQHSSKNIDKHLANKRVVTTIDQILSGYLGFGRESFIRGKNIMRSHLILDEVQLFEPESALLSLLHLLNHTISKPFYNRFCMMTATFPSVLRKYLEEEYEVETYIERDSPIDKEVTIHYKEELPVSDIKENQKKQIIVCNTQKQQIACYEQLLSEGVSPERLIVLNSRLFPDDRLMTEHQINDYFGKGSGENNKILISTQIIEAGMDISTDNFYSYEAPIDSIIQREGRCARWGGDGNFTIIGEHEHYVYDENLVNQTTKLLKEHVGKTFTWERQLKWTDEIMNPLYERILSKTNLRIFKRKIGTGNSKTLIRNMQNVNIIPIDNYPDSHIDQFDWSSISVPLYQVTSGIIMDKKEQKETNRIQTGDTLLVNANEWKYDVCGIRKGDGMLVRSSTIKEEQVVDKYEDYIEETLIEHLVETANQMVSIVMKEGIIPERTSEYDVWKMGVAHDIGKATKPWQRMIRWNSDGTWANDDELYAHRPWEPRSNHAIRNRKHSLIGIVLLKEQLKKIERQVIASHHGRVYNIENESIYSTEWEDKVNNLIINLGFNSLSVKRDKEIKTGSYMFSSNDIIKPNSPQWGLSIYLTGALMEADRLAIKAVKSRKMGDLISPMNDL